MSRYKSHIVVGIDIGSQQTKLLAVEHFEDPEMNPKVLELVRIETEGVYKGNVVNEEELVNTLYKAIHKFKKDIFNKRTHVILSLNAVGISSVINNGFILNSHINNEITSSELNRLEKETSIPIAGSKNKRIIHAIPISYKIDYNKIQGSPVGMFGKRLEGKFLFVFSPNQYIESIESVFSKLNLNIEDIIVGPFAESKTLLTKRQRSAGTALVNIGHSTTSLIVYENNRAILTSVLDVGSNDLTNDIALGLQISLEEAEDIKRGNSDLSYSRRKLNDIIDARVEFISEKINKELDKISRRELLPGGIVLTGEGSRLQDIDYLFKKYLNLPVKFADEVIEEYSAGEITESSLARVYGLTFLAPIVSHNFSLNKYVSMFASKLKTFFKKMLP